MSDKFRGTLYYQNQRYRFPWWALLLVIGGMLIVLGVVAIWTSKLEACIRMPTIEPVMMEVWATGYSAEEGFDEHTTTSNGTMPNWGTCAVDPLVIPYGSILYVPAYAAMCSHYAVALDCGSAILGAHVDLWTETNAESYSLTGWHTIKILRWGWDGWLCNPKEWGL